MLALSRKKNEALVINNNVEITVLEIKGEQVKLGISAPREVPVYRKEVHEQIQGANQEAVNVGKHKLNTFPEQHFSNLPFFHSDRFQHGEFLFPCCQISNHHVNEI